jgi:hypothetical protein
MEARNFLLTTAIDQKFKVPDDVFELRSCIIDSSGTCKKRIRETKFYVLNNSLITSNKESNLDFKNGIVEIEGQFDTTYLNLRISTNDFGIYRKEYDNFSSYLSERGTEVTGLSKDTANIRVMIWKESSKFEYKFTRYFKRYLKREKAGKTSYE